MRGANAGSRVLEYIATKPTMNIKVISRMQSYMVTPQGGTVLASVRGDIEFVGVSFAYPSRMDQVIIMMSVRLTILLLSRNIVIESYLIKCKLLHYVFLFY